MGRVCWTGGVCSVAARYAVVVSTAASWHWTIPSMLTAEALAMAMKIPQHLHDVSDELPSLCLTHSTSHPLQVRRTVKLEFSALLADGTSRVNSEVRVQYLL